MLAQVLAIAVALGSTLLFLTAFLFPKLHRQDDFFWSSVGLFYALVLWVCSGQMVGAVLLGQLASVILLGWLAWEMLRLRQAIIDPTKIPNLNRVSLVGYVKQRFNKPKPVVTPKTKAKSETKPTETVTPPTAEEKPTVAIEETETPVETSEEAAAVTPELSPEVEATEAVVSTPESTDLPEEVAEEIPEVTADLESVSSTVENELAVVEDGENEVGTEAPNPTPTSSETQIEDAPAKAKKGFSFGRLFGKKTEPTAEVENPQSLDAIFAEETSETDVPEPDAPNRCSRK
ncbi:MAG: hypothetical protein HC799_11715 [Limnothrix sp. RL_2_0]|nr:hypothetical protein [Limnothrix sp. RL_2_0]